MMTLLDLFQRPPQVGLELGARVLKVAWASRRRGGRVEWHYREQPRSPEASPGALQQDLRQLLRPLHRRQVHARLILAAPNSYVHRLTLEVSDARRIPQAVQERLPTLLPFDVQQAQFTYRVHQRPGPSASTLGQHEAATGRGLPLGGGGAGTLSEYVLSVAACEAATLRQDLEALWQLGWVPSGVAPSALALLQTARAAHILGREPAVLMEIGDRRTTIVLAEEGEVLYARDVALGVDHLTEALMGQVSMGERTLSLAREEAEALARDVGIHQGDLGSTVGSAHIPAATYRAMIQPVLEQLVSEVRRTTSFLAQLSTGATPQRIIVSGEGSRLPQCDRWLSGELGAPVALLKCEEWLGAEGSASAVTCGLALLGRPLALDLQPSAFRQRAAFLQTAVRFWQGLVAAVLVMWVGAGWWHVRHVAVARELKTLEMRWKDVEPVIALQEKLEAHAQLVRRLGLEHGVSAEWFHHLCAEFPNPVRLTRLSIDAKRLVSMTAEAQERDQGPEASVSEFVLWLERGKICQGIQLGSTHRIDTAGTLLEFTLTCQLP